MRPSYVPVYSTPTPFVYHVPLAAPGPERPTALKFSTAAWCRPLPGSAWRPAPWCPATAAALAASSAAPILARPAVVAAADAVGPVASCDPDDGRGVSPPSAAVLPSLSASGVAALVLPSRRRCRRAVPLPGTTVLLLLLLL